jgi:hypothetical protein
MIRLKIMIAVAELDRIARARLDDAKALLAADRLDAALYICGYAVEVGLKARICRVLSWAGFPNTSAEFQSCRSFQVHELDVLLRLSGQEERVKAAHVDHWSIAAGWRSESRYNTVGTTDRHEVIAMVRAVEALLEIL